MAKDDFYIQVGNGKEFGFAVRAVIIDQQGNFPLIHHDCGWFGLPGGRIKNKEVGDGIELLTPQIPVPLVREIDEECDHLDISNDKFACLGVFEMLIRHSQTLTHQHTVLFLVKHQTEIPVPQKGKSLLVKINELPTPLFPDADVAISRIKKGGNGPIFPEFLNSEGLVKFNMIPGQIGYQL